MKESIMSYVLRPGTRVQRVSDSEGEVARVGEFATIKIGSGSWYQVVFEDGFVDWLTTDDFIELRND
jgi:hypothetical protein